MAKIIKLSEAHQAFLDHLKSRKRAHATILAYGKDIEQLIRFLEKNGNPTKVSAVTQGEIEKFLAEMGKNGYTQKSISRKINSIKTYFRYLKISEFLSALFMSDSIFLYNSMCRFCLFYCPTAPAPKIS